MTSQLTESLESRMPDICVGYLLLDEIGKTNLFSEEQMAIETLPQAFDLFRDEEGSIDYNVNCLWEDYEQDMIRCEPDGVWSQPPLSLRLMPLGKPLRARHARPCTGLGDHRAAVPCGLAAAA